MKRLSKMLTMSIAVLIIALGIFGCTTPETFTVTFKNGSQTIAETTVTQGEKAYSAFVDETPGVTFNGWYIVEGEEEKKFDFESTPITSDITLYARYTTLMYTVVYNLNGAKGTAPTQSSVNADATFTISETVPTNVGYLFKGWSDGTNTYHAGDDYKVEGTDNVVLFAIWQEKTVDIKFFDAEGGEIYEFTDIISYGGNVIAPDPSLVPAPSFCYVNEGWTNAEGEIASFENITEHTNYYAKTRYVASDLSLFTFKLESDGQGYSVSAKNYLSLEGKVALPDYYNGLPVRTVDKQGFANCYLMDTVYIPKTYRTIKAEGFFNSGLTEVYIEEGLTTIEACAFQRIMFLTVFQLPASVVDIHWWGLADMMHEIIYYDWLEPEEQQLAENFAFTTAEDGFYFWDKEQKALFGDNGKQLVYVSPSVTQLTVPDTVETIYPMLCSNYPHLTSVTILGDVVDIGPQAFASCYKLTSVTISGSVENLWGSEKDTTEYGVDSPNHGVFFESAISTITLPAGIKHIGISVFFWCYQLTEVRIANTIEYISEQAFENGGTYRTTSETIMGLSSGGLQKITMTGGISSKYYFDQYKAIIEKGSGIKNANGTNGDTLLFYCMNAAGTEYTIPASVTSLTPFAFAFNKNLTTLNIPEGVEEIPVAFALEAALITVNIPASVKRITNTFPTKGDTWGNVAMWGNYGAFIACFDLLNINFAANSELEFIAGASLNNIGATTITIPAGIKEIEPWAIYGADLTTINIDDSNTYYCSKDGILFSKDMKTLVSYPSGRTDEEYIVPDEVEIIGEAAFNVCRKLRKVTMGAGVRELERCAFNQCSKQEYDPLTWQVISTTGLEEVVMNELLEVINDCAFDGCYALEKITFTGPAPKLVGGLLNRIFTYEDWDLNKEVLFENLKFVVPSEYMADYYLEWYNFHPANVDGFNSSDVPTVTYTFDTNGGSVIPAQTSVMIIDMPIPTKDDAYFYGWYSADRNQQGVFDEDTKISFPYFYKGEGSTANLYARWETDVPYQNGENGIWAYNLTPGKYIQVDVPAEEITWFAFTPTVDCYAKIIGTDMIQYDAYCFNTLGIDLNSEDWWNYSEIFYYDLQAFGLLKAGTTYYFMFINYDTIDYTPYVSIQCLDQTGSEIEITEMPAAILPKKSDY